MSRLWPLLAIAAAAIVLVVFVFGGDPVDDGSLPDGEDFIDGDEKHPELMAAEAVRRKKAADVEAARRAAAKKRATPPKHTTKLFLQGLVVDDATGKPIAGAKLTPDLARSPCPRVPPPLRFLLKWGFELANTDALNSGPVQTTVRTRKDGRFRWMVSPAELVSGGGVTFKHDVFVDAGGYVTAALCEIEVGSEVTVRLKKALKLKVFVTDRHGRPVETATVLVKPGEDTAGGLGHVGIARTDKHGRCEIDGLLPGDVLVSGEHPAFMPTTAGPLDPLTRKEIELQLLPAMRFVFKIRSDDGSEIKNPTLRWTTDGNPPHEDLLLLPVTSGGPPGSPLSEVQSQKAVRIPCDHRNVQLEVKADGFEPWRPPAEPLPDEGGEKELIAVLVRDTSLASLTVHFQKEDGTKVGFSDMKGVPSIVRLDGKDPGSVVLEGGETLRFPALPAGPYRIGVRSPDFAPVEQDVDVVAGEKNEAVFKLRPPAKLRVKFVAAEKLTVRFRLRRSGRILHAFPEGGTSSATDATGLQPLVARGSEGAVFSGLDSGAVTIDVTDPTLAAEAKTVELREGETTEVEIEVRKR